VNVCLKKDYLELTYLDFYFLETEEKRSKIIPKLNLIFRFNNEPNDLFEEELQEFKPETTFKFTDLFIEENIQISKFSYDLNSNNIDLTVTHTFTNLFFIAFYFSILQYLMFTNLDNIHFPPKKNTYYSFKPTKNFYQEGLV
jgi:hypothetical protein